MLIIDVNNMSSKLLFGLQFVSILISFWAQVKSYTLEDCYISKCEGCSINKDLISYDPVNARAKRFADFNLANTSIALDELIVNGTKSRRAQDFKGCITISYEQYTKNTWKRYITRDAGDDVEDCKKKMFERNYKNVQCRFCSLTKLCNDNVLRESIFCYSCNCGPCNPSHEKDQNCLTPGLSTPVIPVLDDESCILTSWTVNFQETYVRRDVGKDISRCLYYTKQPPQKYTNVICKACTSNKCNFEDVMELEYSKHLKCYECKCEMCISPDHDYCIAPDHLTQLSEPMRARETCLLIAVKRSDGSVGIERRKTCDPEYCATRYKRMDNFTKMECTQCFMPKCNNADKTGFFFEEITTTPCHNPPVTTEVGVEDNEDYILQGRGNNMNHYYESGTTKSYNQAGTINNHYDQNNGADTMHPYYEANIPNRHEEGPINHQNEADVVNRPNGADNMNQQLEQADVDMDTGAILSISN